MILLPCQEEIDALGVAKLYLRHMFPIVGLPERVISDRDTRFTFKVFREVCSLLEVKQSVASAYHPQTDSQSKKMNQHVEMALCIFSNFQQDNWSELLPVIQYQLNSCTSNATNQIPYESWMGFLPRAHQPKWDSVFPAIEERKAHLQEAWKQAIISIIHLQTLWHKTLKFHPYQKGEQVWLEDTNLSTSHPIHKLCPKQFGPFRVTKVISPMTYQLNLPPRWQLHNAFHASLLSPYHEMKQYGNNYVRPALELIDREPEWEVAKVLASQQYG